VLAKHVADFGPAIPIAKGIEPFRRAGGELGFPGDLTCRRAIDPESETSGAERPAARACFFAALTAARYVGERRGRPAIPDAQSVLYPAYAGPAPTLPGCRADSICPTTPGEWDSSPDLDALDDATLARTVAIYIASPANPQGRRWRHATIFGRLEKKTRPIASAS